MNDDFPTEPGLRSLEARLTAIRPQLSDRDSRELLFQCLAAGQALAVRRTRRWQMASAAMAVLLVGMSISLVNERMSVAQREPMTMDPRASTPLQSPHDAGRPRPRSVAVPLDAWQVPTDSTAVFEAALTRFKQMDANARSLAVGTMARAAGHETESRGN